jgi:hypothetical protein
MVCFIRAFIPVGREGMSQLFYIHNNDIKNWDSHFEMHNAARHLV